MASRLSTLRALWAPTVVKAAVLLVGAVAAYDSFSSQFGWPTLGTLLGISGSLLPWWGWLLILQAIFVYALFEYVRRMSLTMAPEDQRGARSLREEAAHLREKYQAVISDYQRMTGLEARSTDEMDKLKLLIQAQKDTAAANLDAVQDRVKALEAGQSLDGDRHRAQLASVYGSLAAIYHRERLYHLAQAIEAGASELSAPTNDGVTYGEQDWKEWESKERAWRETLEAWCELASCYVRGISGKVLSTDAEHYKMKGQAQVEQFPDPEAYIGYKEFCALWKNFRNWKGEAEKAVHQVAFNGGTHDPESTLGKLLLEAARGKGE